MALSRSSASISHIHCSPCLTSFDSLDVKNKTSKLVFNSADLELGHASIHSDALKTDQDESSRSYDKKQERTTLHLATPLPAGSKASLQVAFSGELTGSMMGYYKSAYEVEGQKKFYTLTQFEVRIPRSFGTTMCL
jgi:aminopeptidase 2